MTTRRDVLAVIGVGALAVGHLRSLRLARLLHDLVPRDAQVTGLLALLLGRTTIGLHMRAAAADFHTARMLGVRSDRVIGFAVLLFAFFRVRFVMQLVLVLALFAGPVLAEVWRRAARRPALGVALAAAAVYSFAYGFDVNYLMMRDARYAAEAWFGERAPGTTVETYGNPVYLPRLPRHLEVRHHDVTAETLTGTPPASRATTGRPAACASTQCI